MTRTLSTVVTLTLTSVAVLAVTYSSAYASALTPTNDPMYWSSSTQYQTSTTTDTTAQGGEYERCTTGVSLPCVDTSGWGVTLRNLDGTRTLPFENCGMADPGTACFTYIWTGDRLLYTVYGGRTGQTHPQGGDY